MIVRSLSVLAIVTSLLAAVAVSTAAQVQPTSGMRPVEDPLFELVTVVPETWQDFGNGTYTRGEPPADLALIAVQSAAASSDRLLEAILPQLALSEVPDATGAFSSETFAWTLYAFDVSPGTIDLRVELALAEKDGRTYLVLLQSTQEEFTALREQVFVPALEATAPLEPEPTPHPSTFDYLIEEVTFPGGSPGVELAGTLTLPRGPGPHPVVVLMSGSGAQDRDESLKPVAALKPFALIADALTSAGVGVLRYDDRGVGASSGDYEAATVQDLASDGRAAIDYLESRADIDPARIGLLGHSEGGMYAAMLGASDPRIAFIVGMAPAVVDGVELLIAQNEAILRAAGEAEDEIAAARAFAEAVMPAARDGDVEAVERAGREYFGGLWDRLDPDQQALAGPRAEFIERRAGQLAIYATDWFRSLLAYDAEQDWARVTVPVLGLFGARDVQVVREQNEPALREALESAGNDDFEIVVLPDANHLFQSAETGAFDEYGTLEPEFTADFLPTLVDWVTAHAGVAE